MTKKRKKVLPTISKVRILPAAGMVPARFPFEQRRCGNSNLHMFCRRRRLLGHSSIEVGPWELLIYHCSRMFCFDAPRWSMTGLPAPNQSESVGWIQIREAKMQEKQKPELANAWPSYFYASRHSTTGRRSAAPETSRSDPCLCPTSFGFRSHRLSSSCRFGRCSLEHLACPDLASTTAAAAAIAVLAGISELSDSCRKEGCGNAIGRIFPRNNTRLDRPLALVNTFLPCYYRDDEGKQYCGTHKPSCFHSGFASFLEILSTSGISALTPSRTASFQTGCGKKRSMKSPRQGRVARKPLRSETRTETPIRASVGGVDRPKTSPLNIRIEYSHEGIKENYMMLIAGENSRGTWLCRGERLKLRTRETGEVDCTSRALNA